jgi:UDP-N-acetylmuramate--L-alanine ligase
MNLEPNSKIHFIGIGGIGMSAAAGMAKQLGFDVSGSDSKAIYNPAKSVLDEQGINYRVGYDAAGLPEFSTNTFIASAGEDETNPEIAALRSSDTQIYSLAELFYELFKDKLRIVVTGTHGKSTTAAMLGLVLSGIDNSSFMTGAVIKDLNRNYKLGNGHYAVFEGDEYKALYDDPTPKFMQYKADILLLTNLEFDHPDIFSSLDEISAELEELIHKMPDDGVVVYNADDIELTKLAHNTDLGTVSFALDNPADFVASDLTTTPEHTEFTVQKKGDFPAEKYQIKSFGRLNVYNALGPVALLRTLGFAPEQVQSGLDNFNGLKRRFEFIGEVRGAKVFDDYAHHPTAIKETLAMARLRFPNSRIWSVFEPHTFSRTKAVLTDLTNAFTDADQVLISEIYPAREQKTAQTISGSEVVAAIGAKHSAVRLVSDKKAAQTILETELQSGDIVIIMAVGDFNTLAGELTNQYAA